MQRPTNAMFAENASVENSLPILNETFTAAKNALQKLALPSTPYVQSAEGASRTASFQTGNTTVLKNAFSSPFLSAAIAKNM